MGNAARILVHYCSLIRSLSIIVLQFITYYFILRNCDKFYEGGSTLVIHRTANMVSRNVHK